MSQVLTPKGRLLSLDVYRGFTMILMASAGFGFAVLDDNPGWRWLAHQFDHVPWEGFVIWDLIQPSFIFIVGAAMPFAFAIRSARGESRSQQLGHVFQRSITLLVIGMAIVWVHKDQVLFDLTTVLQQIAVAYFFAFFVLGRGLRVQALAALGILAFHWACFQFGPGSGPGGPWIKNANFASWLDLTFLGRNDAGGYTNFNAVSSIATVILGIMAGELIRKEISERRKALVMGLVGIGLILAGTALHSFIPVVKRIWTPSWTLFSGGWAFLLLAVFYWMIEIVKWRKWCFIFTVVGMNSIGIYVLYQMLHGSINSWLWVFTRPFLTPIGDLGTIIHAFLVLAVHWYFVYWLYKRDIFLKVG
ncbi:MAG: DUF5009 domain-containing protein [Candidatus Glassbacteria bacterium]